MSEGHVWLERLSARDFRNFEHLDLELPVSGLAVIGENGQGKTNLLEAIYYLQVLRSVRGARDQDLVRFGARGFYVSASIAGARASEIGVGFETAGKRKKVTVDGAVASRLSDAFGSLPSVMFSPRDIELVAGGPADRRRYLDLLLALSSRPYLRALQGYRGALARRNAALRVASRTGEEASVAVWEPTLAEHGAVLLSARSEWVAANADPFADLVSAVGEEGESVISYRSTLASEPDPRAALEAALERHRKHDMRRAITHSGPHRDDLLLTLNGKDLRVFGSAGQQRTAAIALRMLESAALRSARGVSPLLLLDDPFAELDGRRSSRILELLASAGWGQTILAVPRPGDVPPALTSLARLEIHRGIVGPYA